MTNYKDVIPLFLIRITLSPYSKQCDVGFKALLEFAFRRTTYHYIGFANMSKRIFSSRAERLVSLAIENKSKSWGNYNPSENENK